MLLDERYIAFVLFLAGAVSWAWATGPLKVVDFVLMCFSDNVNMVNIIAAFTAYNLKVFAAHMPVTMLSATTGILRFIYLLSEATKIITPIVICISAIVVLAYNIVKFYNITYRKED